MKKRVQLHPATDLWMQGARYGTVEKETERYFHVKLDVNDRVVEIKKSDVIFLND